MRFTFAALSSCFAASLLFAGCSLDEAFDGARFDDDAGGGSTLGPDGGAMTTPDSGWTTRDAQTADVVEAGPPPPPAPCSVVPGACVAALPKDWAIVSYQASQATPCADPFTPTDVVSNPVAIANACGCACTVTTAPVCDKGSIKFMTSSNDDATCGSSGSALNANGDTCNVFATAGGAVTVAGHSKSPVIAPSGGACTAAATTTTPTAVTTTAGRICSPPAKCQEQLCAPDGGTGGGYATCIAKSGIETACPPGWGATPVVVGTTASLSCANDCTCDVNGPSACTGAKLSAYTDTMCKTLDTDIVIDGNCNANPHGGDAVKSWKYSATLNQVCNTAGSKTATVSLNGSESICCRP